MLKFDDDTFKLHESSAIENSLGPCPGELLGGEVPLAEHLVSISDGWPSDTASTLRSMEWN